MDGDGPVHSSQMPAGADTAWIVDSGLDMDMDMDLQRSLIRLSHSLFLPPAAAPAPV